MNKKKVLYLSYTGILEPLGRSQILCYLFRLSDEYSFIMVSFEKPQDMADKRAVAEIRKECSHYGITWCPRIYHHRPRLLATAWDLLVLLLVTLWFSSHRDVSLLHCRSYIPAISAWICGKVTRKPFVFDMRGLWPDELVTAGRLKEKSLTYKALKWVERRLLRGATKVVVLTEPTVDYLIKAYPEVSRDRFVLMTTYVDVRRFSVPEKLSPGQRILDRTPLVVGTIGTLTSGWFCLHDFFAFFKVLKKYRSDAVLSIVTQDNHSVVLGSARAAGVDLSDIRIVAASPSEVPGHIAQMDVGVIFYAPDKGRAPTRLAEFLATGIPVVGNSGVGDLGRLIDQYEVGIVIDDLRNTNSLDLAVQKLLGKYDEIVNSQRCRATAEDYFSVEKGANQYRALYYQLESLQQIPHVKGL